MNPERTDALLYDINGRLSSIESKLDSLGESILRHESRITNIETYLREREPYNKGSFKDEIVKLLVKCLLISLTSIATLCGASSLLKEVVK